MDSLNNQASGNAPKGHRWPKGTSGNPRGRCGDVWKLRAAIAEHVPAIIAKLVELAKAGDAGAARLLLERTVAPLKAADQAAPLAGLTAPQGALSEQGRAVVAAAAAGDLTPSQAVQYLTGMGTLAKLIETDELAARIAALEAKQGNTPATPGAARNDDAEDLL